MGEAGTMEDTTQGHVASDPALWGFYLSSFVHAHSQECSPFLNQPLEFYF